MWTVLSQKYDECDRCRETKVVYGLHLSASLTAQSVPVTYSRPQVCGPCARDVGGGMWDAVLEYCIEEAEKNEQ